MSLDATAPLAEYISALQAAAGSADGLPGDDAQALFTLGAGRLLVLKRAHRELCEQTEALREVRSRLLEGLLLRCRCPAEGPWCRWSDRGFAAVLGALAAAPPPPPPLHSSVSHLTGRVRGQGAAGPVLAGAAEPAVRAAAL